MVGVIETVLPLKCLSIFTDGAQYQRSVYDYINLSIFNAVAVMRRIKGFLQVILWAADGIQTCVLNLVLKLF